MKCPNCGYSRFYVDTVRDETVCGNCGFVMGVGDEDFTETGVTSPRTGRTSHGVHGTRDEPLGLTLRASSKDAGGNLLSSEAKGKFGIMARADARVQMSSRERRERDALEWLQMLAQHIGLPGSFRDRASVILRGVLDAGVTRGRPMKATVAACVFVAARSLGAPRSLKEVAVAANVEVKSLGAAVKLVTKIEGNAVLMPRPADFIARFVSNLELPLGVQSRAFQLTSGVSDEIAAQAPAAVAAAAVYLAAKTVGAGVRQSDIADAANVSTVSIRKYAQILAKL